jgi:hypothetical protein
MRMTTYVSSGRAHGGDERNTPKTCGALDRESFVNDIQTLGMQGCSPDLELQYDGLM